MEMKQNEWMNWRKWSSEQSTTTLPSALWWLHTRVEAIFTDPTLIHQCSRQINECILRQPVTQALAVQLREEEEARSIEKPTAPQTQWLIYCIRWASTACLSGLKNFSYQTPERSISARFTGRNIMENWDGSARIRGLRAGEVSIDIEG